MLGSEQGGRVTGATRSASPAKRPASEMEGVEQGEGGGDRVEDQQETQKAPSGLAAEYDASTAEDLPMSGMTPASNGVEDAQDVDASSSSLGGSSTNTAASSTDLITAVPSDKTAENHSDPASKEPYTTEEIDAQVAHVQQLTNRLPLDEGDKGIVISQKWLDRVQSRSSEGKDDRQYSKDSREGPVGPLDNSDITPEDAYNEPLLQDMNGSSFIPLKPGLAPGKELRIFPCEVYEYIIGQYGTRHKTPIVRYAHNTTDSELSQNIEYETHPLVLTLRKVLQPAQLEKPAPKSSMEKSKSSLENLKARKELRDKTGQHSPNGVRVVASKNEKVNKFMIRAKEAAGIQRTTKVKVFRALDPANVAVDAPDNKPSGVPLPPESRPASPNGAVGTRLIVEPAEFSKMRLGADLEVLDIHDNTANPKYNGSMTLGTVIPESHTLIFEEQMGGPAGGEFVSDTKTLAPVKTTNSTTTSGRTSPAPTGMMTRGRATRNGRVPGTVGLTNLGNTCYMNSALQCIRSVEELAVFFLTKKHKREINGDNPLGYNGRMAHAYASVIDGIYGSSASSVFGPRAFKTALGNAQPMFSGWGQQDSQEFLSFLVDALHEDLNRIKKKPYIENPDSDDATVHDPQAIIELGETYRNNHKSRNDSVAMDLFSGFYKNKMECPVCDKVSVTFDPFSLLTVQLPINVKKEHIVTFIPIHGKPVRHRLEIDSNAPFKALKEAIASKHPGVDANRLVMTEVFSHKTYKLFSDSTTMADDAIQKNDYIFFYEVDGVPTNPALPEKAYSSYSAKIALKKLPADPMNSAVSDCFTVPIFHRMKGRNDWEVTMHPSYITVTREEAKNFDVILKKILIAVSTLTTRPILKEFSQGTNEGGDIATDADKAQDSANAEDAAGVSDHSNQSEDGYVNVEMGTPATEITDSQILANGTSAMRIEEHEDAIPQGFMDPEYTLSPALRSHLFDILVGGRGDGNLHVTDVPRSLDLYQMLTRVKLPSRRSSTHTSDSGDSGDSGSEPESNEPADAEDEQHDSDPDIFMGGEQSQPVVPESDSEDVLNSGNTLESKTHNKPRLGRGKNKRKNGKKFNKKRQNRQGFQKKKDQNSYTNGSYNMPAQQEDSPYYVQLGEAIVLNWKSEAFDALFEGDAKDAKEMRGCRTTNDDGTGCEVFPDPELDARRAKMHARQKNGITLDECFVETGKREVLSEDNAWYCNRCKEMRLAAKTLQIWTLPDILVVHLKRFGGARGSRDKIDVHVDYPIRGLDMSDKVGLKEDGKEYIYDLFAVDNHYGGLGGGHYTAMAKNFHDGQWYDYNGKSADPQLYAFPFTDILQTLLATRSAARIGSTPPLLTCCSTAAALINRSDRSTCRRSSTNTTPKTSVTKMIPIRGKGSSAAHFAHSMGRRAL